MVNKDGYILHKTDHKKGRRHDYDIYKENRPVTPKQVVNVLDLGYLDLDGFSRTNIIIALQEEEK